MTRFLRTWLLALRPLSFTAAVIPVLAGTAVVAHQAVRPGLFVLTLLGSVALQGGTNLVNDYFDHEFGTDTADSLGPSGVIQSGLLTPRAVLSGAFVMFAIGAAIGLVITALTGWPVLVLGVVSVIAGYAYTAPPLKLAYRALGEVTVFVFMGVIIVMGAAYVQTEQFTLNAFLASLPVGLLTAAILHANNLRDIQDDRANQKHTLASLAGRPIADYELVALVLGAFLAVAVLAITRDAPLTTLIALFALLPAVRLLSLLPRSETPRSLNRVLGGTAALHMLFGTLWALGFAIDAWVS
jgi:1,4-dihydroxy-2-naphthoate octaprenyltransferase